MTYPWMRLYTRDWLDNKELRRCSPLARSVLIDLMCLASEGQPFGHLADKVGPLTVKYMASRCVVTSNQFLKAVAELEEHARIGRAESGVLFIPRMVEDETLRQKKEESGRKGGNPKLKVVVGSVVNQEDNHGDNRISGCGSDSDSKKQQEPLEFRNMTDFPKTEAAIRTRFRTADWKIVMRITAAATTAYLNEDGPKIPPVTDEDIAAAVEEAVRSAPGKGVGLLLTTVPNVIRSWAKYGRHPPANQPRGSSLGVYQPPKPPEPKNDGNTASQPGY